MQVSGARWLVLVAVLVAAAACGSDGPANTDPLLARLAKHCGVAGHALKFVSGGQSGFNGTVPWHWRTSNGHTVVLDPNNNMSGDQQWRVECDDNAPEVIHLSTTEEDHLGVRVDR